jgi:hypothetical protein
VVVLSLLSEWVTPPGPWVVLLLEFSCTDGAGSYGVFDSVVVVSLELEDKGRATTTGGLTSVFVVTVLLVTLGAAGTVVTMLSDSIVVWHHALPARPTAIPIAAAKIHKVRDFISSILRLLIAVLGCAAVIRSCGSEVAPGVNDPGILSFHRYPVPGQGDDILS